MKNLAFILFSSMLFTVSAQIPEIKKKDSCYLRYDANGEVIKNHQRYSEWECGKLAGVVDCNQRLEYDEGSNIVYLKNDDMVNAAGGNKPFTGLCETCHMNGAIERRVNFVNGKEDGIDTTYYKTGCPQVVRSHIQGVESGQWLLLRQYTVCGLGDELSIRREARETNLFRQIRRYDTHGNV